MNTARIDIQPIVDELTRILETGHSEHGDPLARVRSIISELKRKPQTSYQAEKSSNVVSYFETWLKPRRSITEDELSPQRHSLRIAISGLKSAYDNVLPP